MKGKAAIVPETALQLEQALGVPAEFWLTREARYREWIARREADEELREQVPWLRDLPLKEMLAFKWIASGTTRAETVRACLSWTVKQPLQVVADREPKHPIHGPSCGWHGNCWSIHHDVRS